LWAGDRRPETAAWSHFRPLRRRSDGVLAAVSRPACVGLHRTFAHAKAFKQNPLSSEPAKNIGYALGGYHYQGRNTASLTIPRAPRPRRIDPSPPVDLSVDPNDPARAFIASCIGEARVGRRPYTRLLSIISRFFSPRPISGRFSSKSPEESRPPTVSLQQPP